MLKKLYKILFGILALLIFSCKTTQKKDENFLGDFNIVGLDKIMAATVSRTDSTLSPKVLTLVFSPRTNVLSFHHRYMGDNIWVSLDYKDRQMMIKGINAYLDSFKNRTLTADNSKKKGFFGKTPVRIDWGVLGLAHFAIPNLRFEYQLFGEKKLPYFILATATTTANKSHANSPAIRVALSPAKCQEFLRYLDQDYLLSVVKELQDDFEKYDPDPKFNLKSDIEKNSSNTEQSIEPDEAEFEF